MWPGSEFEKVRSMLCQIVVKWRLKLYSVEMSWWRCETGKRLLSFAQGSLHEFLEFAESWSFVVFGNVKQFVCETWNLKLVNLFLCDFHSCERWFVEFVVAVVHSCLQQLIWWLVWGFWSNHFDQLTISCLHSMSMTVVCVAASVGAVVFLCGLPWNGDSRLFWPEVIPVSHGMGLEKRV